MESLQEEPNIDFPDIVLSGIEAVSDEASAHREEEGLSFDEWKHELEAATSFYDVFTTWKSAPVREHPAEVIQYLSEEVLPKISGKSTSSGGMYEGLAGGYFFDEYDYEDVMLQQMCEHIVKRCGAHMKDGHVNEGVMGLYKGFIDTLFVHLKEKIDRERKGRDNTGEYVSTGRDWDYEQFRDVDNDNLDAGTVLHLLDVYKLGEFDGTHGAVLDMLEEDIDARVPKYVAEALSKVKNVGDVVADLLERLRDAKTVGAQEIFSRTLYLIELGKIGVDEGVVTYLENKYTLVGDKQDQIEHARRITGDGKIGLFDAQGGLAGFFELGDLADPEVERSAEILEVSRDLLFSDPNTPDNIRQQFLADYTDFYEKVFGEIGGVRMSDLTLREQIWMYQYWKDTTGDERWQKAMALKDEYGIDGVRAFVSLEDDRENGDRVLNLSEYLSHDEAEMLFGKYSEMVSAVDNLRAYLLTNFEREELDEEAIRGTIRMLLKRGADLISGFSQKIGKSDDAREDVLEALDTLKDINVNVLTFGSVMKQLPRDVVSNLHLEEMPIIEKVQDITGEELAEQPELLAPVLEIIRKQFPTGDDEVFVEEIKGNKDIRVTISLLEGEVLSFFAKKKIGEGVDYVDWFISNPDTSIKGLGEATVKLGFRNDIEKGKAYYAVAKPHVRSFPISIESLGFTAFGGSTDDGEYKHHYVRMSRLPEDSNFAAKEMNTEKKEELKIAIAAVCHEPNDMQHVLVGGAAFEVCKVIFGDEISHNDDVTKDDPDGWIMAEIERQFGSGKVLTSFIAESSARMNKTYYAVFENDMGHSKREAIHENLAQVA